MRGWEHGGETVQFALTVPLFLLVLLGIIQVGGMTLVASQLSSEVTRSCRQLDVAGLQQAADKGRFVEGEILGASTQLAAENLHVSDVRVEWRQDESGSVLGEGLSSDQSTSVARLSYALRYDVPSALDIPGLSGQSLFRHVDCTYVAGRVVEVSVEEGP